MGQRHMTYVITVDKYNETSINTIYNQWNYRKLQAIKLERTVKYFNSLKYPTYDLFETFYAVHGLSPECGWVGGRIIDDEYKNNLYTDILQEDNNNGWTIIKIIQDNEGRCKIELCCILGSEDDVNDTTTYEPLETKKYFENESGVKEDYYKSVDFIASNTVYNPKLKKEASKLLKAQLINKKPALK